MARPQKCGMDYFPHDTDALTDEKIEALRMLYGNDGYAFYFILLERIYRTEQFELDISDSETIQILSRKIGITEELFNKMLHTALKRNCFDNFIYNERKCLTSAGIKKRADVVISKRVASKESYNKKVSATETMQETTPESTQSKEKERKEEVKDKNIYVAEIIEYLNKVSGKSFRVGIDKTTNLLNARWKEGFTNLDDYKTVIDVKCKEWLKPKPKSKQDKDMSKYVRPETLFGNKFESYLNEAPKQNNKQQDVPFVMVRKEIE